MFVPPQFPTLVPGHLSDDRFWNSFNEQCSSREVTEIVDSQVKYTREFARADEDSGVLGIEMTGTSRQ